MRSNAMRVPRNYGLRQPSGKAIASVMAGAGDPGSLPYSFSFPVTVSVTRIE